MYKKKLTFRVHFFGKIQKWIIAWDHTDSFFVKETKNPKTDYNFSAKTACHMYIFRTISKETQKRRILRIRIQINPSNPRRERIYWIHNPFLDLPKKRKNPILDSESGLEFLPKKCTLSSFLVQFTNRGIFSSNTVCRWRDSWRYSMFEIRSPKGFA